MIVAERAPGAGKAEPGPVVEAIRAAVSRRHAVPIADVRLVAAGAIPAPPAASWPGGRAAPSTWRGSWATATPPTESPGAATG